MSHLKNYCLILLPMSMWLGQFSVISLKIQSSGKLVIMGVIMCIHIKKNFCFISSAAAVRIGYEEHMPGQVSVTHSSIFRIIGTYCIQRAI